MRLNDPRLRSRCCARRRATSSAERIFRLEQTKRMFDATCRHARAIANRGSHSSMSGGSTTRCCRPQCHGRECRRGANRQLYRGSTSSAERRLGGAQRRRFGTSTALRMKRRHPSIRSPTPLGRRMRSHPRAVGMARGRNAAIAQGVLDCYQTCRPSHRGLGCSLRSSRLAGQRDARFGPRVSVCRQGRARIRPARLNFAMSQRRRWFDRRPHIVGMQATAVLVQQSRRSRQYRRSPRTRQCVAAKV